MQYASYKIDGVKANDFRAAAMPLFADATIKAGLVMASGDTTVEASGNTTVEAMGNATVRASGDATVRAWDNTTVEA